MTVIGRPFCWPCRHYHEGGSVPGPDPSINILALIRTCAAFPDGIPSIVRAGGFDHREPHPDDNGVQFEMRTDERFDWDEEQTNAFLDRSLRNFNQRQRRAKAHRARARP